MANTPVIVSRRQRGAREESDFTFLPEMMRLPVENEMVAAYREAAWNLFKKLPMPNTKDEPWRRTDLHLLKRESFRIPAEKAYLDYPEVPEDLLQPLTGDSHGGQVVMMPGGVQVEIDEEIEAQGVVFTDLRTAEEEHPEILSKIMGKVVSPEDGKFAAMTSALVQEGVLLYVPRGVHLDKPLHSLLWGPGKALSYFSHIMVYLEEDSSVTYVHEAASPTEQDGQIMHAGIVEIYVGPAANLRFVELQSWGEHVWNFSHERVKVDRDGNLDWIFGAVGSHLTKNFSDLDLIGRGSTGRMSGFYFTDHDQHLDHDTQQNHLAPNTTSDLLFKGALLGESRSVWQGMIYVAPGASKTDGYQANRNLVLSNEARADSIPGLEIKTDDVRCTHGATVGKIDPEPVFYLQSRGIPKQEAERLVVEGFFDPIMQRIPFDGVRERFQKAIHQKMANFTG